MELIQATLGQGLHWLKDISLFVLAKAYQLNLLVYILEEQHTKLI